jgi:hypothetical protein
MLAQGATLAAKKPVVFGALLSHQLSAEAVLAPTQAQATRLSEMESCFCNVEFEALRDQADAMLESFLAQRSGHAR